MVEGFGVEPSCLDFLAELLDLCLGFPKALLCRFHLPLSFGDDLLLCRDFRQLDSWRFFDNLLA